MESETPHHTEPAADHLREEGGHSRVLKGTFPAMPWDMCDPNEAHIVMFQ